MVGFDMLLKGFAAHHVSCRIPTISFSHAASLPSHRLVDDRMRGGGARSWAARLAVDLNNRHLLNEIIAAVI
jgi:hypothetical protein